jgi:hypothetical protein
MTNATSIKDAAQKAMLIQDASNLQAVLRTWAECQSVIRSDSSYPYARHPVNILFMSKVSSLMQVDASSIGIIRNIEGDDLFDKAWAACEKTVKE